MRRNLLLYFLHVFYTEEICYCISYTVCMIGNLIFRAVILCDVRSDDDHISSDVYISNYHEIDTNSQKFYPENLVL